MKFSRNQKGQGLIEYLIIVSLMSVAAIAVLRTVGQNVRAQFARASNVIQGKKTSDIEMREVSKSSYEDKDMGDFFKGASKRGKDD